MTDAQPAIALFHTATLQLELLTVLINILHVRLIIIPIAFGYTYMNWHFVFIYIIISATSKNTSHVMGLTMIFVLHAMHACMCVFRMAANSSKLISIYQ